MTLRTQQFIEKMLGQAEYKLDDSIGEWIGWVDGFPGVYAQGEDVETVRQQLAEVLEEYLFLSFQKKQEVPGFELKILHHAEAN
ncbi:hypothetical protein A2926_00885 [Candidatus Giovannonibacteria bacterium RIFCSPLOWO2_01_FULL_44_40]|uniref:Type II toxin-antitoxin system HicB family antitoxin n=1 Tax=Candidatus Giovannonibacteria bacterium RIFCSPHIGHO2_01_FULL_45_23 TaxID=1798325 RepID=A0A1F5VJ81_9BACT|nr:MAG: hypothetical protein A2834_01285 [Candidatus Giovannonibacteria bacterium RIFCSPHIGHO2_01_FULL_45_23]OGF75647.1 MAG: hypothetical protein A3C77_03385 [Candidatus Giovannonibacteria bacterium RIFCSPHIGHO2_02_FULL_45_13]OGF80070.1 MAG: hypothetical protein A2926_00885 [Candidatus Giovannonibacteria bacterium RIFCSPLOWO2_01_FULL_44_40]